VKILSRSMVVMKDVRKNGMYVLNGAVIFGSTSITESTIYSKIELCHIRLGHISENGLVELNK